MGMIESWGVGVRLWVAGVWWREGGREGDSDGGRVCVRPTFMNIIVTPRTVFLVALTQLSDTRNTSSM